MGVGVVVASAVKGDRPQYLCGLRVRQLDFDVAAVNRDLQRLRAITTIEGLLIRIIEGVMVA
jgi:hypothetical protein